MKNILLAFSVLLYLCSSCTKEAEYKVAKKPVYNPVKYGYRACEISGENAHWGKFTLKINYENEVTDSITRIDANNRIKGRMSLSAASKTNRSYKMYDYVYAVDADSIKRLDEKLANKYGAGNYSLEDSIPIAGKSIFESKIIIDDYGKDAQQTLEYYTPFEDPGVGADFNNEYTHDSTIISRLEFDENAKLVAERIFKDVYLDKDGEKVQRTLFKREYVYLKDKLSAIIYSKAESGENFTEIGRDNYVYSDNKLTEINGYSGNKTFAYEGNKIIMTENGAKTEYELNEKGFLIAVKYPNGSYMNIKYEEGNGDFEHLTPMYERHRGLPFIK